MAASAPEAGDPQSRVLEWKEVNSSITIVKATFWLGFRQSEGLTTVGIAKRLFSMVEVNPDALTAGSTPELLQEETEGLQALQTAVKAFESGEGPEPAMELDTTMTLVTHEGKVAVISPAAPGAEVFKRIEEMGEVVALVAPNVQHWLFLQAYAARFPEARVYLSEAALEEDLADKMPGLKSFERLQDGSGQVLPCLEQVYLQGAVQAMHEVLFLHKPSNTLICSDAFYPGYPDGEEHPWAPQWFARLWFKLTKAPAGYKDPVLPIYRTARVASAGSPAALLDSLNWIDAHWTFTSIISAHGFTPYTADAQAAFRAAWVEGCSLDSSK